MNLTNWWCWSRRITQSGIFPAFKIFVVLALQLYCPYRLIANHFRFNLILLSSTVWTLNRFLSTPDLWKNTCLIVNYCTFLFIELIILKAMGQDFAILYLLALRNSTSSFSGLSLPNMFGIIVTCIIFLITTKNNASIDSLFVRIVVKFYINAVTMVSLLTLLCILFEICHEIFI